MYPIPEPLEGDVFLCSYPKSGRTWVRQFLAQYMSLVYGLGYTENYDLMKLMTIVPAEWWLVTHPNCFKYEGQIPRVRSMHFLPDERVRGKPVIWLTRNPHDTLVSYYYHEPRTVPMSEFVRSMVHELVFYYNAWDEETSLSGRLHVTYEGLHNANNWWFRAIVHYIGLEWNAEHFETALERSAFRSMRKDQEGTTVERVRKGVIGGYKDELAEQDIAYVENIVKKAGPPWMPHFM